MLEEEITLKKLLPEEDDGGYDILTVTEEKIIFADILDPFREEFYSAMKTGHRISKVFKVVTDEYAGEQRVEFEGVEYSVLRSHPVDRIYTLLICKEVI